jgi:hypothetical protein
MDVPFTSQEILLLGFVLLFALAIWLSYQRQRTGLGLGFRDIAGFVALKREMSRSIESGHPVHIGLGVGGVSTDMTADSLAAVEILDAVTKDAGLAERMPIVTLADATLLPLVQDRMGAAAGVRGHLENVRWIGPSSTTYAVGVMGILASEDLESSTLAGVFGDEYLLMGGASSQHSVRQIGAVSEPAVLPFAYATADELLLGEELYAAGAYLAQKPWHMASLKAQDWMRWLLVLVIIGLVIASALG